MHTVIITHYVPSKIRGRKPNIETDVLTLEYSGLYPNHTDIKAVNVETGMPEKLGVLHAKHIANMLAKGVSSEVVSESSGNLSYHTSYALV